MFNLWEKRKMTCEESGEPGVRGELATGAGGGEVVWWQREVLRFLGDAGY